MTHSIEEDPQNLSTSTTTTLGAKKKKRVAFLSDKLTIRGTGVAMYDYADCNETILGNESLIITRSYEDAMKENDTDLKAYTKYCDRFEVVYYSSIPQVDDILRKHDVDVIYIIKAGRLDDGMYPKTCRCVIHAVFDADQPHGDAFAVVGPSVNARYGTHHPVVPHMIRIHPTTANLRVQLNIPPHALVFGGYGGMRWFDIYQVMKYIHECSLKNVYFLFMNTFKFSDNPNVIFLPGSTDMATKRMFINTCDAMIHARIQGETFGLACGEFALAGKPIITYALSSERTHLQILKHLALTYTSISELDFLIRNFDTLRSHINMRGTNPYVAYSPENVMRTFAKVFLEEGDS